MLALPWVEASGGSRLGKGLNISPSDVLAASVTKREFN
jgi:hypothetical protein